MKPKNIIRTLISTLLATTLTSLYAAATNPTLLNASYDPTTKVITIAGESLGNGNRRRSSRCAAL
mgnify:CR=1 FL=1